MVWLSTYKSYRSLLLLLCYTKHSVGSKLSYHFQPQHQLHIEDDYELISSKLTSVHYYLGYILSYETLQHFERVLVQGYVREFRVYPGKMLVDIHPRVAYLV